jgi:glyoxylate reductase
MARCFVTRVLPGNAIERLQAEHDVDVWSQPLPPPEDDLRKRVGGCDGLLSLLTDAVDAKLIQGSPRLRAISNLAVGTDNIDLAAATACGIPVGNTPDVLTESTADLAVALMLAISRRLSEGEALVRSGGWRTWEPGLLLGRDLNGATVVIVGGGRIGRALERRLGGFDARVVVVRRNQGFALDELLARADFVSLHVPLTEETRGFIGEGELRAMKETAYLVNTSRGPIVDQDALARALREGWIAGAALDVTDPEPLPADHPLLEAPNLLVVPHIGSATHRTREAMADMAVTNLLAGLAGEPMPYCVNPEVYRDVDGPEGQ